MIAHVIYRGLVGTLFGNTEWLILVVFLNRQREKTQKKTREIILILVLKGISFWIISQSNLRR